jgi:hypothetical protein
MPAPSPEPSNHGPPLDDGETYRLLPPEPKPAGGNETTRYADESWAPPQDARPKRRKRRRGPASAEQEADSGGPAAVDADAAPEWKPDTGWQERPLLSAAWFPLTGSGWKVLLLYSGLLWAATLLPLVGAGIAFIVMVLHSVLLLETANYTLEGIPGGPRFPDVLSWDTISAGLMGLVAFMIAGLPLLIGAAITFKLGGFPPALQIVLVSVALFYLPMAFLALAEQQNERALNPLLVFRGIKKLPVPYVALCGVATSAFLFPQFALMFLGPPPAAQMFLFSFAWLYVSIALIRAVALVGRKQELTFE